MIHGRYNKCNNWCIRHCWIRTGCCGSNYKRGELEISTPQPPQSLEEFFTQGQNEIILGHNNSQQRSLAVFNRMGQQIQQVLQMLTKEQQESKRLRELLEKNKIDHKPKSITAPATLPDTKK